MTEKLLAALRVRERMQQRRQPEPSAGSFDSQTVKGADTVGRDSRSYDAGKKVNGRKRFIITDTLGLLVAVTALAASWQDHDGAKTALLSAYMVNPIVHVLADQGFTGRLFDWTRDTLRTTLEIIREPADQRGFAVHSRRWVMERTLARLTALPQAGPRLRTPPGRLRDAHPVAAIARRITSDGPARRQARRTFTWT